MKIQIESILFVALFFMANLGHPKCANSETERIVPQGTIKGRVVDAETKNPLPGASIILLDTKRGTMADTEGNFVIGGVPVGGYTVKFTLLGYEPLSQTDIIVRSNRTTFLEAELTVSVLELKGVTVTSGFFSRTEEQPTSVINFSSEEIRRAPGSAGDVSRIILGLPSLAKVNDQSNDLIVRGGSPIENAFYIDNIEIPNINHFPTQGASGGAIGVVNVDFIQDVNFHTGGFSAKYGDKLSSVMDIILREGNRSEFDGQLDLNFAGFGGQAEGPMFNRKGSWLLSVRRSFLDLLVDAINTGTDVAPRYGDFQGKTVYDINANHKLIGLIIGSDDHNSPDKASAVDNDMIVYGNQNIYENTAGIDWRALWSKNGYSNTSISYASSKFNEDYYETSTDLHLLQNRSWEQAYQLRNLNYFRLSQRNSIECGVEFKHLITDYRNFYAVYTDAFGDTVPSFVLDDEITANKMGIFVDYIAKPFTRLTTTLGVRGDYFSYSKKWNISPRLAFSYQITNRTWVTGSTGLYYQNLPLILLSQNEENRNLKDPVAVHYILGIEHLITENTKFTLEVYQKDYSHFPVDPTQPALFLIDEIYYRYGFFFNHQNLLDKGKAFSRGVEVTIQKKLAERFYGLTSASYFRTRYQGSDGIWRDRVFDNRFIFSIEGGYKPNRKWEFSLRWIYAGGPPYTPFDLQKSKEINREVLDENRINQSRYPDYHSLNVRFDRRFNFKKTNLIFYFSIWNAYNRKNIASYFWNEKKQKQDVIYQWSFLPIFGLEYEF